MLLRRVYRLLFLPVSLKFSLRLSLLTRTVCTAMAQPEADLPKRFEAAMVLGGVGDALGYKNGTWEVCRSGERIHEEAKALGGIESLTVNQRDWIVSDDTVMQIATADALLTEWSSDYEKLYTALATKYKECMRDMAGRAPGLTCSTSVHLLKPHLEKGYVIPFNPRGGGCGAAMRAAPIGLYYWRPDQIGELVAVSIEAGRMTHHHPTGYLGSLAVALFVSYSVQKKPLREWGAGLMDTLKTAKQYVIENSPASDREKHVESWSYFEEHWTDYLKLRQLESGTSEPIFKDHDTKSVRERDVFYRGLSFSGTGGASGHDAPMIAYEALLNTWKSTDDKRQQWIQLCSHSMFHGGDSDSTGIIAASCWGAMEGYSGVPENHYAKLEYHDRLKKLGTQIYEKVSK